MFLPIAHVAWRSLSENRLTLVLLAGAVAAGVGFQIPNNANLDGYQAELLEHGLALGMGDVRVRPRSGQRLNNGQSLARALRDKPHVRAAVPVLWFAGAAGSKGKFRDAPVFGVDRSGGDPIRLLEGEPLAPGDDRGVVLGAYLAGKLGVGVGDPVEIRVIFTMDVAGAALDLDDEGDIGRYTMIVRGLAAGTFGAYQAVFLDHELLARDNGTPGAASGILLYLDNHFAARRVARRVRETLPADRDIEVTAWMDEDAFLHSAINATHAIGAVSQIMVIFAVAIPVLALLYINILRRRRDIGLLSAIGFDSSDIFMIFLLQAAFVGMVGIIIGCAIGYGLIIYFQYNAIFAWSGFVVAPVVSWGVFLRPAGIIFVVTLLSGAYPAWRASRVDPARVLRGAE